MGVQGMHITLSILAIAVTIASGIIGWFISEMRLFRKEYTIKADALTQSINSLSKSLTDYVLKTDCAVSMTTHCDRIQKLQDKYQELNNRQQRLLQIHCSDGDIIA